MDQYRYFTRLGNTRRELSPLNVRNLNLTYNLSDDDRQYAFVESFTGDLVIDNRKGDFNYLLAIEQSGAKCRRITLEIEKRGCDGQYSIWKTGILRLVDGSWHLDDCTLTIKPLIENEYTCYEENKARELNLLELPLSKVTVKHLRWDLQFMQYQSEGYFKDDPSKFGGVHPSTLKWKCYRAEYFSNASPAINKFNYVREVLTLPLGENPGREWAIIQTGADVTWARFPTLADYTELFVNNEPSGDTPIRYLGGKLFAYNIVGDKVSGVFNNGMPLNPLLSHIVGNYCGLTVKSNFLQINPDRPFAEEYPGFTDGLTHHDVLFQKSDIKRPSVSGDATIALFTLEKLLTSICKAYNLRWRIENGEFIIEHVSHFQRAYTLDTTTAVIQKRLIRTRQYTYKADKLPRLEVFSFMETGSKDFAGLPIEYPGDCATDVEGNNKAETAIDKITTDVELCLMNSDSRSKVVSDEGFVLMATHYNAADDSFYTITVPAILDTEPRLNNCLGWAFLHREYFQHERLQLNGYLNGSYTTFKSVRPVKKRMPLGITLCCSDSIDLSGLVKTNMGDAVIGGASFVLYHDELKLDLLYPDLIGNAACLKPMQFLFHHLKEADSAFYFYTQFEVQGNYRTEVEAIRPDGMRQTFTNYTDEGGITPAIFEPFDTGIWRFRKRVVCDADFASQWTDYITVNTDAVLSNACSNADLLAGAIHSYNDNVFLIRFVGVTISYPVEIEVTAPEPGTYVTTGLVDVWSGGTDISVAVYTADLANMPHGLYRFRFRKVCDAGVYSQWSDYVEILL